MSSNRPRPVADLHSEPYWEALGRKILLVQACASCSRRIHPSAPCCSKCLSVELEWVEVGGEGVVVSYCVVAQPLVSGIAAPYVVLCVSLLDAPDVHLIANVAANSVSGVAVGARVHVVFDLIDDDFVLANFELVANAA